ncbi:flagellar protein FlgN [Parendozoicomonas haliclonae]|uniref:FlgN protein n=1 Tax=Parendozoicomonas haliclonae TaxID=1960125 RepID=A0A1X7AGC3_9GAMM|nr:flagellar protein FlgN [Parendozoicomonas haliclonae]SMA39711.1 FlgN protein [Parendozoicomonas haliclonae]
MDALARNILDAGNLFDSLETTLLAQHRHLLERDMAAVEDDTRQLKSYLARIRSNVLLRNQQLVAAGFSADETGMQDYLNALPEKRRIMVEQQWRELELKVTRCREINSVNGRLQGRLRSVTAKLLGLIWGQIPGRAYNRFGQIVIEAPKNLSGA